MASQLVQVGRRLGYRLGKSTGLFKPTTAQCEAEFRAFFQSLNIDYNNLDDEAVKIYWGLKSKGQDLPFDAVTTLLKYAHEVVTRK